MPPEESKPTPTLWTAAAPTGEPPIEEAQLAPNLSVERIEAALDRADERSKAFAKPVTNEMLARRY